VNKVKQRKLRVGVIGVGHLGEYHVQKYKAMPDVDLVGVVDANPDRAEEIAARYGVKAFSRHGKLLDKVNAVSLAVPTEMHFDVAKDVLAKGVHLLIEKPITYELAPADVLISMAREKDLVFQVGLVERFNPAVVKMESLLDKPVLIESHRMNEFTTRGIDVDVVLDLMIHDLDIILHNVPSEVKEVHAVGMSVITGKTDIANARLIFEDGTVANLSASRVSSATLRKIRVFQPNMYLSVNCLRRKISIIRLDVDFKDLNDFPRQLCHEEIGFPSCDPLADEIASFVDAVIHNGKPVVSGDDGRKALKVALGIIGQIEKGSRGFEPV
jgi:predicted dehydrogenase